MAKFDALYPDAADETVSSIHDGLPPVVKLVCKEPARPDTHACSICNEKSQWANATAKQYVCSTECNEKIWKALLGNFVVQQLLGNA